MTAKELLLKTVTAGGPMPVGGTLAAMAILGTTIFDGDRKDILLLIGVALLVLSFVEWAISRRFVARDESEIKERAAVLEAQQSTYRSILSTALEPLRSEMNRMVMVFDSTAATNERQYKEFQRMRESVEKMQSDLSRLMELRLEERIAKIEQVLKVKS